LEISAQQSERIGGLGADGLVVYDIQDEGARNPDPRPFPFLPTIDPELYAFGHLHRVALPKIVYRSTHGMTRGAFADWLERIDRNGNPALSVLVGAPSQRSGQGDFRLHDAYAMVRARAPRLLLGGIAIAERHARKLDEHERILAKMDQGCRFFITQAVYDVTSTKSLLSDYAQALQVTGRAPVPLILTFSPCGSLKTLEFMKWLGISFPRWLENDLRFSADQLETSVALCESIFRDVLRYAGEKGIPIGINVESVSIRKPEIEASVELFLRLRDCLSESSSRGPRASSP
jgi:hypothetical protein